MAGAADDAVRPAGTAGLTEAHRRAWEAGAASLESIASELNVSKQAIHKAFKRRGWAKGGPVAAPASEPAGPAPASAPADTDPTRPADDQDDGAGGLMPPQQAADILRRATLAAVQAHLAILAEGQTLLAAGRGHIAPTTLQRLQATIERSSLFVSAVLAPRADDTESLTELRISVLTPEEEAAMRQQIEEEFQTSFGDPDGENDVVLAAESQPATQAPSPPRPALATPRLRIVGGLPGRQSFKPWLEELSRDKGARFVRQIGGAVGLKISAGEAVELVVDRIVHQLDGDPERLRRHVEIVE